MQNQYNYYEEELKKLDISKEDIYKPIIKIIDGKENSTNYMSITLQQYEKIKNILIEV